MILINKIINCSFDRCGNVYFSLNTNTDNEQLYEINIKNDNTLICDKYVNNSNFNSDDDSDDNYEIPFTVGELVPLADTDTLRGKAMKEKENQENEHANDYDEEYDMDYDEDATEIRKSYYYEDKEFNEYVNENDEENINLNNLNNSDDPMFSFNSDHKIIKPLTIKSLISDREEHNALYEVLVYEGSPESSHIIFKTKLLNDTPIYRMCIYTSGVITFRPIGSTERKYKLSVLNNNIVLI